MDYQFVQWPEKGLFKEALMPFYQNVFAESKGWFRTRWAEGKDKASQWEGVVLMTWVEKHLGHMSVYKIQGNTKKVSELRLVKKMDHT